MPFDSLRLRQAFLQLESEILSHEALAIERDKAALDLKTALLQRDESIRALTAALAADKARIAELEEHPNALQAGSADEGWTSKPLADKLELCLDALDGWCTRRKAEWLTRFILDRKMQSVAEIGVFGGKSLVPITLALQETGGFAVGVEPWSNQTAVAEFTNETNDAWWSTVDLAQVKTRFYANTVRFDVLKNLRVLEMDSDQAFGLMKEHGGTRFDLVHVDGAHSPERALKDAITWSSLVHKGGLVVFDDIAWPSVTAARTYLTDTFGVVDEVFEPDGASYGAYQV